MKMLSLSLLSKRRTVRDLIFLHKVANGAVDSAQLLAKVSFHIPIPSK